MGVNNLPELLPSNAPAGSPTCDQIILISQIDGLPKRCFTYGYCLEINTVEDLIESVTVNFLKIHKINTLSYFQLSHKRINPGPKDIPTRSLIIQQNYINVPLFHISK